jgi:hypothetical protein
MKSAKPVNRLRLMKLSILIMMRKEKRKVYFSFILSLCLALAWVQVDYRILNTHEFFKSQLFMLPLSFWHGVDSIPLCTNLDVCIRGPREMILILIHSILFSYRFELKTYNKLLGVLLQRCDLC